MRNRRRPLRARRRWGRVAILARVVSDRERWRSSFGSTPPRCQDFHRRLRGAWSHVNIACWRREPSRLKLPSGRLSCWV